MNIVVMISTSSILCNVCYPSGGEYALIFDSLKRGMTVLTIILYYQQLLAE